MGRMIQECARFKNGNKIKGRQASLGPFFCEAVIMERGTLNQTEAHKSHAWLIMQHPNHMPERAHPMNGLVD